MSKTTIAPSGHGCTREEWRRAVTLALDAVIDRETERADARVAIDIANDLYDVADHAHGRAVTHLTHLVELEEPIDAAEVLALVSEWLDHTAALADDAERLTEWRQAPAARRQES